MAAKKRWDTHVRDNFDVVDLTAEGLWSSISDTMDDVFHDPHRLHTFQFLITKLLQQQAHIYHYNQRNDENLSQMKEFYLCVENYKVLQILLQVNKRLDEFWDPAFQMAILDMVLHKADDEAWKLVQRGVTTDDARL